MYQFFEYSCPIPESSSRFHFHQYLRRVVLTSKALYRNNLRRFTEGIHSTHLALGYSRCQETESHNRHIAFHGGLAITLDRRLSQAIRCTRYLQAVSGPRSSPIDFCAGSFSLQPIDSSFSPLTVSASPFLHDFIHSTCWSQSISQRRS
jgi:hypothetical protein